MKNSKRSKTTSSQLQPRKSKDKHVKLTPIRELTEKQTLLLPNEQIKSPLMAYAPQKLSAAITARLRTTNQHSSRLRASFITANPNPKINKILPVYINSQSLLNRIQITNQQKISNLLTQRKRNSHSQSNISVICQNSLPSSCFKRPSQATRQILRLTKIRELFNSIENKDWNQAKVVESYSNLVVQPQKLTLKNVVRYTRSVCKTDHNEHTQRESGRQKKHQCPARSERAERLKILKIKPIKLDDSKSLSNKIRQTYYEIGGWNVPNNQTLKQEQEDLLYESYSNKRKTTQKPTKTAMNSKQWESAEDNQFLVTRTNTTME